MPQIRGWAGGEGGGGCSQTQVTKLCAQWARQMATAALTIPRGERTSSGIVWDYRLPY